MLLNYSHVSKNVTNVILNNFNKLELILIIFAQSISRIFLQIAIIFSYWTSSELTLPWSISQWHKWRVTITSSVPQSMINKAVDQWCTRRLHACVKAKDHQFEQLLQTSADFCHDLPALIRTTHRFLRKTTELFFVVNVFSGSVTT